MVRTSCLAGIDREHVAMFETVLRAAGVPARTVVDHVSVAELGKLAPGLLVCDLDGLDVDPLEKLRQLRFVLPASIIAVYTDNAKVSWSKACHLAGANGLFSKASSAAEVARGIKGTLRQGCFTDPRFAVA
jgi:DNA-binding NarL/FixJ family response regulator